MTLNKSRWIVRLFFWSVGILDAFTDGNRKRIIEAHGTNLCFFFQITFVWVPVILILHALVYGGILAALIVGPILFFGAGTYASGIGALLTLAALIVGVATFGKWMSDRRRERRHFPSEDHGPSSLGIAWQWVVAQKEKVCPLISFTQGARV